jgi:hypothetical protein
MTAVFPPALKEQRDALVRRIYELESKLYAPDDQLPSVEEAANIRERLYASLAEYSDILPRVVLSACPWCGEPLKRVFDPFGLDGPWWHVDVQVKYEEPAACEHFRVLLGALALGGGGRPPREPREVKAEVRPGPDAPFVVPALLQLPGMKAVVSELKLPHGDVGYPVAYFSSKPTKPVDLHQPWCRDAYWIKDDEGNSAFSIANDLFDFALEPYVKDGRLRWVDLEQVSDWLFDEMANSFPFFGINGDRERQQLVAGTRDLIGLPTGEALDLFG